MGQPKRIATCPMSNSGRRAKVTRKQRKDRNNSAPASVSRCDLSEAVGQRLLRLNCGRRARVENEKRVDGKDESEPEVGQKNERGDDGEAHG